MNNLSTNEWRTLLSQKSNAIILDVRTPNEWQMGIIPSAICADIMDGIEFVDQLERMDKSAHYFVYCRSGMRSADACTIMARLGFEYTYNLGEGLLDWSEPLVEYRRA